MLHPILAAAELTIHFTLLTCTGQKRTDPELTTKLGKLIYATLDIRTTWLAELNALEKSIIKHLTYAAHRVFVLCTECTKASVVLPVFL